MTRLQLELEIPNSSSISVLKGRQVSRTSKSRLEATRAGEIAGSPNSRLDMIEMIERMRRRANQRASQQVEAPSGRTPEIDTMLYALKFLLIGAPLTLLGVWIFVAVFEPEAPDPCASRPAWEPGGRPVPSSCFAERFERGPPRLDPQ
jgi:hypothetical protein